MTESDLSYAQRLLATLEDLLARAGGDSYDPEVGARQSAALARYIGRHYVSVDTASFITSRAREHELMTVIDYIAGMPSSITSPEVGAIASFAGNRAAIIRHGRDTGSAELARSSSPPSD